ncbi:MAG: MATE family efflux transporter [Oscillospiraceae bacterium]
MENKLSQQFTFLSLLKFTIPTILMLVFMALYQMVDGVFISNTLGQNALSAVNIVYPIINVMIAISIMLGNGGSAIIAKNMGEGKDREAKENFSLIYLVSFIIGIIFSVFCLIFINDIIRMLGATDALYKYSYDYLLILIITAPFTITSLVFQVFIIADGKPHIGLLLTVIGGVLNVILDYIFLFKMNLPISSAAIATSISYAIPSIFGLFYFLFNKKGSLYFVKPKWRKGIIKQTCFNGSSEMVSNLSNAITTFLFNIMMLKFLGEAGVSSITIILYSHFFLTAIYIGFSGGVAPIISYNFGQQNYDQIKNVFKICIKFILFTSIFMFLISFLFRDIIISVFASNDKEVFDITKNGFTLFSIAYLFSGFSIFASGLFTAFSNGMISATISMLRTFVFIVICLLVLPNLIGITGIWLAVPIADILSLFVSLFFIYRFRKIYKYF